MRVSSLTGKRWVICVKCEAQKYNEEQVLGLYNPWCRRRYSVRVPGTYQPCHKNIVKLFPHLICNDNEIAMYKKCKFITTWSLVLPSLTVHKFTGNVLFCFSFKGKLTVDRVWEKKKKKKIEIGRHQLVNPHSGETREKLYYC